FYDHVSGSLSAINVLISRMGSGRTGICPITCSLCDHFVFADSRQFPAVVTQKCREWLRRRMTFPKHSLARSAVELLQLRLVLQPRILVHKFLKNSNLVAHIVAHGAQIAVSVAVAGVTQFHTGLVSLVAIALKTPGFGGAWERFEDLGGAG